MPGQSTKHRLSDSLQIWEKSETKWKQLSKSFATNVRVSGDIFMSTQKQ